MALASNNRIINGGYEAASLLPWYGVNAVVSNEYSRTGTYAAHIEGGTWNAYIQQFTAAFPGETFELRLSLAIAGSAPSAPVVISVLFYTVAGVFLESGLIAYVPGERLPPAASGVWYDFRELTSAAPAATASALVIVNKLPQIGSPDILADDVELLAAPGAAWASPAEGTQSTSSLQQTAAGMQAAPETTELQGKSAGLRHSHPSDGNAPLAYVTNSYVNLVTVFNTATSAIVKTIPVGSAPSGIAIIPKLNRIYVTNFLDNTVSVIDTATHKTIRTIQVGWEPAYLAAAPNGSRVYVSNSSDDTISVIDTAANATIDPPIPVASSPQGIIVSPDSSRIYVASSVAGTVTVINAATNLVVATVADVGGAKKIAMAPNGTRLYVASDEGCDFVTVIETSGHTITGTMTIGAGVEALLLSPDGALCYAAIASENAVTVVDIATNAILQKIGVGPSPVEMAGLPDGSRIYVTNFSGDSASVINTSTNTVTATIPIGTSPSAIAINA